MLTEENGIAEAVPEEEAEVPAGETAPETAPPEPEEAAERGRTPEERDREIRSFLKAYPEMRDLGGVPQGVWEAVAGGETLLEAWRAHEIGLLREETEKLRREKEDLERRESNRARSTGSQRGSAADAAAGFDALWYDGN